MTGRSRAESRERAVQSDQDGRAKKGSGGGGSGGGSTPCNIQFQTTLASPNPAVVGTLAVGTVFVVAIAQTTLRGKVVSSLVAKLGSQIAGTVDDIKSADVIECIGKGFKYKATVSRASGGDVVVVVENS